MRAVELGGDHVLALEPGEQVIETLARYLTERHIAAARVTAIGAFRRLRLKYFDMGLLAYDEREMDTQVEVVSLTGNVALFEGQPYIHAHVVVSDQDYHTYGGHLEEATVEPTLELFLTPLPGELPRERNARTGLTELRPDELH